MHLSEVDQGLIIYRQHVVLDLGSCKKDAIKGGTPRPL